MNLFCDFCPNTNELTRGISTIALSPRAGAFVAVMASAGGSSVPSSTICLALDIGQLTLASALREATEMLSRLRLMVVQGSRGTFRIADQDTSERVFIAVNRRGPHKMPKLEPAEVGA